MAIHIEYQCFQYLQHQHWYSIPTFPESPFRSSNTSSMSISSIPNGVQNQHFHGCHSYPVPTFQPSWFTSSTNIYSSTIHIQNQYFQNHHSHPVNSHSYSALVFLYTPIAVYIQYWMAASGLARAASRNFCSPHIALGLTPPPQQVCQLATEYGKQ